MAAAAAAAAAAVVAMVAMAVAAVAAAAVAVAAGERGAGREAWKPPTLAVPIHHASSLFGTSESRMPFRFA